MQGMSSLVQGAARAMRSGLQTSSEGGFEAVPALDQSPQRDQMPAIELDQPGQRGRDRRSEEHTSELQSLMRISYAVFCLKKKKTKHKISQQTHTHHH